MALLYHYIAPGRPQGGAPSLPPQLSDMTFLAADPCSFNDPFEVRPYFDQERHDHSAKSHESFYEAAIGIKHSLRSGRSMAGIPTENAVGFGERLNKRFRDELGKRFRVRAHLKKPDKKPLHFRDLRHEHRLVFVDAISQSALKTVTVLVHKPSLKEPEKFQERYRLYYYSVRYLLERVSWSGRDHRPPHDAGDGSAEIVFSNRSGMSYADLREYMAKLKRQGEAMLKQTSPLIPSFQPFPPGAQ